MSAVSVERIPRIAPGDPDAPGQRPRVDPLHPELAVRLQERLQVLAGAPVARILLVLPDDESFEMDAGRLHVLRVDPGVADQRVGHRDDLSLVGGIGEDLLVAGHPRVEDDLPQDLALPGKGRAPVNAPVLQDQQGLSPFFPASTAPRCMMRG